MLDETRLNSSIAEHDLHSEKQIASATVSDGAFVVGASKEKTSAKTENHSKNPLLEDEQNSSSKVIFSDLSAEDTASSLSIPSGAFVTNPRDRAVEFQDKGATHIVKDGHVEHNDIVQGRVKGTEIIFNALIAMNGGTIIGATANQYGYAVAYNHGVISGGTAQGTASLDAVNGGTVVNGTAQDGGVVVAGGGHFRKDDPSTPVPGVLSNAHIGAGGAGIVGGANLTTKKNGVTYTLNGAGISSDAVVDAGGLLDINPQGTEFGGTVAGMVVVQSNGTMNGALFSGLPEGGLDGVNGYVNAGASFANNTIEGGAVVDAGGGTVVNNTIKDGGTMLVDYGNSHYIASDSDGWKIHTGGPAERGTSIDANISAGGVQSLHKGCETGATIHHGGKQIIDGGIGHGDKVRGGTDIVKNGGTITGTATVQGEDGKAGTLIVGKYGNHDHAGKHNKVGHVEVIGGKKAGATVHIGDGGTAGTIVAHGGKGKDAAAVDIESGATARKVVVSDGAVASFAGAGATANVISVKAGGTALNAVVASGMTLHVDAGGYVSGATIGKNADKHVIGKDGENEISYDGKMDGRDFISSGGTGKGLVIEGGIGSGNDITKMGGLLVIQPGATLTDTTIGDYGQIEIDGANNYDAKADSAVYTANKDGNGGTLALTSDGTVIWESPLKGHYNSSAFTVWDDPKTGKPVIVYDICFLKGTHIETPLGERVVEELQEGDEVFAVVGGQKIARKITMLRRNQSEILDNLPDDLAGWSVCIRAGAFSEGVPKRDLRVTPEHCFFFEGKFIPVRMLVNGSSIFYDKKLKYFEFYHIETEPHSILLAEGALTESWLQTDTRRKAVERENGFIGLEIQPRLTWEKDAAVPLDVSPAFAENLWNRFNVRSLKLGYESTRLQTFSVSKNPDLRLSLGGTREIKPVNRKGNKYFFQVPAGVDVEEISLLSKTFRPFDAIGPWIDDRRNLGVLVGKLTVAIGEEFHQIEEHLYAANAQGWDIVENSPCRWTKGKALLPVLGAREELRFGFSLIVEVLAGGPYPKQQDTGSVVFLSEVSFR